MLQDDSDLPKHLAPALLVMKTKMRSQSCGGALATALGDPNNHREAMAMDEEGWRPSEIKELSAHRRNGTFSET